MKPEKVKNVQVQLIIPAQKKHLHIISANIAALFEDGEISSQYKEDIYAAQLGVHEACVNIIEHSYKNVENGEIFINMEVINDPIGVVINIHDTGKGFDPETIPSPKFGELQYRGFGLYLIRELIDDAVYSSKKNGNHWYLKKIFAADDLRRKK